MTAATTAPAAVRLRVPECWYEFDIWRATHTRDLTRLVYARIEEHPALALHRQQLIRLLRETARTAERGGAVLCAAMAEPMADAGILLATLMVLARNGAPEPSGNTPEAVAAQLTSSSPSADAPYWRNVQIVETAVGRGVRVAAVEPADVGGAKSVDAVVLQTLLPLPNGRVVNIVLASPQVRLAEPLLELFDAITATAAWDRSESEGGGLSVG